jgi:hypothetical protein
MHRKAEEEADSSAIGDDDSASFFAPAAPGPAFSRPRRLGQLRARGALGKRGAAWTRQTPDELEVWS